MAEKVKVGIIGLGFMGTTHLDIYRNNPKAQVVAIADVNAAKLKGDISSVVGNIGGGDNTKPLDLTGIETYADGMDLINDPEVQLVDICVPVFLHKKFAVAALKAGKHVLCEKPVGRNSKEAEEIIAAAKTAKGVFMVGMCIRFWPEYAHARKLFKSGKLGKLRSAVFRRLSPNIDGNSWENWFMNSDLSGGALYDLHLHDADAVRYFFGMPRAVSAFGVKGVRSTNGVDHVVAVYHFDDDALVIGEGGWDAAKGIPFEMSFQIVGDKGSVRFASDGYTVAYENGTVEKPAPGGPPTGWHAEIDYLLNCIQQGKKPNDYMEPEEIIDSVRIAEAELRAIDIGGKVEL